MAIGVEALSGVCFFVLTGAHHIPASKDGCDALPCPRQTCADPTNSPFKLHFASHTTWLRPPSHCAFLPNSLQTPSRYSCHIYSQHTLPCSITGANPLLHSTCYASCDEPVFTSLDLHPSVARPGRHAPIALLNPPSPPPYLLFTNRPLTTRLTHD